MNWLKYKKIYFVTSILMIGVSLFSLLNWKLKLGVDFTGGTVIEYHLPDGISTEEITSHLGQQDVKVDSIAITGDRSYLIKMPPVDSGQKEKLNTILTEKYKEVEELKVESVGPSIGPELIKKTSYAIIIAAVLILIWVAYQFKSFIYGASAILAMFHDTFILIGSFSILGHFYGAEVDFLFVTALLTTLSFSVHDTIVVFDRIREINANTKESLENVANRALTETMVRSLNNSFTILFMLVALLLLGGSTIKWFSAALLIGTLLGTYSSPFVAAPLLVSFDNLRGKLRK